MDEKKIPTVEELLADIRSLTKEQKEEVRRFINELIEKRQ